MVGMLGMVHERFCSLGLCSLGTMKGRDGLIFLNEGEAKRCRVRAQKHKKGKIRPQSLMKALVDCSFLHCWYLECVRIGRVCEEGRR